MIQQIKLLKSCHKDQAPLVDLHVLHSCGRSWQALSFVVFHRLASDGGLRGQAHGLAGPGRLSGVPTTMKEADNISSLPELVSNTSYGR